MEVFAASVRVLDFAQKRYPGHKIHIGRAIYSKEALPIGDSWRSADYTWNPDNEDTFVYISPSESADGVKCVEWNPFYEPVRLWSKIAQLDASPATTVAFIKEMGFLTTPIFCEASYRDSQILREDGSPIRMKLALLGGLLDGGERLSVMQEQIKLFRQANRLWELSRPPADGPQLHDLLLKDNRWWFESPELGDISVPDFEGSNPRRAAMRLLIHLVNSQLEYLAAPKLLFDGLPTPQLFLHPHNLAGVAWLELAQDIARSGELARCAQCGTWFSTNVRNGKNKKYCVDACKSRAHRQRRKQQG